MHNAMAVKQLLLLVCFSANTNTHAHNAKCNSFQQPLP